MREKQFKINRLLFLALSAVFLLVTAFFLFRDQAKALDIEPVQSVLQGDNGESIRSAWKMFLSFANSILILVLLVVAFSNILHLQIDNYGVKKILPSLIIAILLANFSWFICIFLIDIANMVLRFILEFKTGNISGDPNKLVTSISATELPEGVTDVDSAYKKILTDGGFFWQFVGTQLIRIVGGVMITLLAYLMIVRNWVIYFLVALSPLGFIAMALPQTKSVFQTWFKQFIQWVFMAVVSAFWLWVGSVFVTSSFVSSGAGFMKALFAIACFYLALTTPFKLGGAIMQKWNDVGKKAWGATGGWLVGRGAAYAKSDIINPRIDDYKNRISTFYAKQGEGQNPNWLGRIYRRGSKGKWMREQNKERTTQQWDTSTADTLRFMNDAERTKWAEFRAVTNGLGGEIKRKTQQLDVEFAERDEGKQHRRSSDNYKRDMANLDARQKIIDLEVQQEAYDKDDRYFEVQGDIRREILDQERWLNLKSEAVEAASNKTRDDDLKNQSIMAVPLHSIINQYQEMKGWLDDPNIDWSDEDKKEIQDDMAKIKQDYANYVLRVADTLGGEFTPLISAMTGAEKTADGKVKMADIDSAETITGVFKTAPSAVKMTDDRLIKIYSRRINEERAVESGKRNGLESARLLAAQYMPVKAKLGETMSVTDRLLNDQHSPDGLATRNANSMLYNMEKDLFSPTSTNYRESQRIWLDVVRQAMKSERGDVSIGKSAEAIKNALTAAMTGTQMGTFVRTTYGQLNQDLILGLGRKISYEFEETMRDEKGKEIVDEKGVARKEIKQKEFTISDQESLAKALSEIDKDKGKSDSAAAASASMKTIQDTLKIVSGKSPEEMKKSLSELEKVDAEIAGAVRESEGRTESALREKKKEKAFEIMGIQEQPLAEAEMKIEVDERGEVNVQHEITETSSEAERNKMAEAIHTTFQSMSALNGRSGGARIYNGAINQAFSVSKREGGKVEEEAQPFIKARKIKKKYDKK
jgi:hypothetical protein